MRLVTKVGDGRPLTICLGRATENEVTELAFDLTPWITEFGSGGTAAILLTRPTETVSAPVLTAMDGNIAYHVLTDGDLQYTGDGEVQIVYTKDTKRKKSATYNTRVLRSLSSDGTAPSPWQSWVDNVLDAADEAENSATAAAASATNAASSATAASASKDAAATSETNAAASATNASNSASAASTSATNAAGSATAAETSATNASNSASAASSSATNAAGSASSAEASKNAAAASESNAATSEANASNSASAASTSATNAANSASAAGTSETNASNSASAANTSATNAANSASAASASETNAASSASAASDSKDAAATSATAAATSATNSATSASQAAATITHYPYVNTTTNTWYVWDVTNSAWVNTGVNATGTFHEVDAEVDANTGTPSVDVDYTSPGSVKFKFHNIKGEKGNKGNTGERGETGTFNSVEATVDANIGTPEVDVTYEEGDVAFAFKNLKGQKGDKGDPGLTDDDRLFSFAINANGHLIVTATSETFDDYTFTINSSGHLIMSHEEV